EVLIGTSHWRTMMETERRDPVYVVPVKDATPPWSTLPWIGYIEQHRRYFHPVGKRNWPSEPVPRIGFRFRGQLHSVHRVKSHLIVQCRSELAKHFPEIDGEQCRLAYDGGRRVPHIIYTLGVPEYPQQTIRSGGVFGPGHVWIDRDLL